MAQRTIRAAKTAEDGQEAIDLGPLPALLGYALRRAQLAVFQDFHHAVADLSLTPAQFGVLVVIRHNPGLRQSQLAAALGIKRTNLVPLLAELERRGLAERQSAHGDRRATSIRLTAAGGELLALAERLVLAHDHGFDARLGARGRTQLLRLLSRLA
jgi:DNA-binding MarR family transcriptional regulator